MQVHSVAPHEPSGRVTRSMWGMLRRCRPPAAIAISVLLLAGCGDDTVKVNNAYVGAADRVVQSFNDEFQTLQAEFTAVSTPAQDLKTLTTLQQAVDKAVDQMAKVTPPDSIAALHKTLVARVRGYEAAIATAKTGFASDDPRRIASSRRQFSARLAAVGTQVMTTINTINAKLR